MKITRLPSEEEKAALLRVADSDQRTMIRQRAKVVLQALEGKICRNIAEEVRCDKNTVSATVQGWLKNGIGSIVTWARTTTWMKQVKRRQALKILVTTTPTSLKLSFSTWSIRKVCTFFTELVGYRVNPSTVCRDLSILGISYKTIKDEFIFKSPDYDIFRA